MRIRPTWSRTSWCSCGPPTDPTGTRPSRRSSAAAGEEIGRNRQTFYVEPGKFGYRLVKGELEFPEPGTIEACCSIVDQTSSVTVPVTALPLS